MLVREEEILQNAYFFINVLCFHQVCIINCANKLFFSILVSSGYENINLHALHEGEYSAIFTSISENSYYYSPKWSWLVEDKSNSVHFLSFSCL